MEYEIILTVNGLTREYKADYDTITSNDWNDIVEDLIDSATTK